MLSLLDENKDQHMCYIPGSVDIVGGKEGEEEGEELT